MQNTVTKTTPTPPTLQQLPEIVAGVEFTSLGLLIKNNDISIAELNQILNSIYSLSRASNWILGDSLSLAERTWGNKHTGSKYEEASQQTGLSVTTLRQIVSVCKTIPYERRYPELSFTHHMAVSFTFDSDKEQDELLQEAKDENMSAKQLRKHLREVKQKKVVSTMYYDTDENFDRPFGITNVPKGKVAHYPLAEEITRISAWFEDRDLRKLPKDQRQEMLSDLVHIFRDGYALFQLELKANPDVDFELPFEIKSLAECPPDFMKKKLIE